MHFEMSALRSLLAAHCSLLAAPRSHASVVQLFLKNLELLFSSSRGNFSCNNTVIVDNSPRKHIMNKPENVVLPDAWSNQGFGDKGTFLLNVLLPYLRRVHENRDVGLKSL